MANFSNWNEKKDKFLTDYYPMNENKFLAKALGVSVVSLLKRATFLKLKKRKTKHSYSKDIAKLIRDRNPKK